MSLSTPQKFPVKVYSSEDAHAPLLTDSDGALKTVLKACLVTGYGDKEGAGWQLRYENDYSLMLRPAMQVGNPPDIQIDNGNGKHQINGVYDATSLDNTTMVSIVTKQSGRTAWWRVVACDFGFLFLADMIERSYTNGCHVWYVGALKPFDGEAINWVTTKVQSTGETDRGYGRVWMHGLLASSPMAAKLSNNDTSSIVTTKMNISLNHFVGSPVLCHFGIFPFYAHVGNNINKELPRNIVTYGRPMLHFVQAYTQNYGNSRYVVPTDYWEL